MRFDLDDFISKLDRDDFESGFFCYADYYIQLCIAYGDNIDDIVHEISEHISYFNDRHCEGLLFVINHIELSSVSDDLYNILKYCKDNYEFNVCVIDNLIACCKEYSDKRLISLLENINISDGWLKNYRDKILQYMKKG